MSTVSGTLSPSGREKGADGELRCTRARGPSGMDHRQEIRSNDPFVSNNGNGLPYFLELEQH
ncbi:hypothetical protein N7456_000109 [Penicillium angulare]|uniref:Uncharacterized protein n=1 Tax=Penicillium angulare TaxID=116970 RepID=A0A9W9GBY3_9EURO|nr:hypothetical protein N7456_000109 [Penicillium angulare]